MVLRVFSLIVLFTLSCVSTPEERDRVEVTTDTDSVSTVKESHEREYADLERDILNEGSVTALSQDGSDLWVGKLQGGVIRYNYHTRGKFSVMKDTLSIKDNSIKKILIDENEVYIVRTDSVWVFHKKNSRLTLLPLSEPISLIQDAVLFKDRLWLGTHGKGLFRVEKSGAAEVLKECGSRINTLAFYRGRLYTASSDRGVSSFQITNKGLLSDKKHLVSGDFTVILPGDEKLWLADRWGSLYSLVRGRAPELKDKFQGPVSFLGFSDTGSLICAILGEGIVIYDNEVKRYNIHNGLLTNNITVVLCFDGVFLSGTLKKGVFINKGI